jgi:molybdopterin converting factor subunit 1
MRVRVLYFAAVRDVTRLPEEPLELPGDVRTVGDFGSFLIARYPGLAARLPALRFARNEAFSDASEAVGDGDVIAVIPPVAGG